VGEVIGRGACGKVFKGLNFQNGTLVAIKQIKINNFKEEHKKSLQSEINLLKKLEHPNIVKYIGKIYSIFTITNTFTSKFYIIFDIVSYDINIHLF
jgi:serine/threonine protein kinase